LVSVREKQRDELRRNDAFALKQQVEATRKREKILEENLAGKEKQVANKMRLTAQLQEQTERLRKQAEQKKADIGIAMGGVGSDIALDAADIALVDDEVKELPHLIALSRRMMITIKCNMSFSMGLNFVAIVLAIIGILNPVVGALVHNAGSVLVIINSALLLQWKQNK
jgi:hypothetical protein